MDNPIFRYVREHANSMLACGRDNCGEEPGPLFAGTIDVGRCEPTLFYTIPPPGIRLSDFNWCGNNLMHDIPFLETLNALSRITGDGRYAEAVDRVFAFYGANCPHPDTGLFPWGEHAQWSFPDRRTLPCHFSYGLSHLLDDNYITHDHLRFAPEWFWEGMWKHHPDAVVRFAHGLNRHIVNEDTFEHNRHASLTANWWRDPKNPDDGPGKDFARHAGHYIFDCLFAYRKSGDRSLPDWCRRKLDWHLDRRLPNGIIRGCARTPGENQEGQHDALALCVWDAAELLESGTPENKEFADAASELMDARLRQVAKRPRPAIEDGADETVWLSGYFRKVPGIQGRKSADCMVGGSFGHLMYERTGTEWYADSIVEHGRWTVQNVPPPPSHVPVLAKGFSEKLDLTLAAYAVSGDNCFLQGADRIARWASEALFRNGLFMGASNMRLFCTTANLEYHQDERAEPPTPGLYYSVSGTPLLVRNLLRLALLQEGEEDVLGADRHSR